MFSRQKRPESDARTPPPRPYSTSSMASSLETEDIQGAPSTLRQLSSKPLLFSDADSLSASRRSSVVSAQHGDSDERKMSEALRMRPMQVSQSWLGSGV